MIALALFALLQDPAFDTIKIDAGPRVDRILTPDVNGDGFPDLLLQCGRDLRLHLYEKGFAKGPSQTLRLQAPVFLWTLASLDGKRPALLTAGSRAIQAHAFDGRTFAAAGTDLVVHPSLFEGEAAEEPPPLQVDFAPDLDGDGRAELLLFQKDGMIVMRRHAEGDFRGAQKLPLPVDVATAMQWNPVRKVTEITSIPILAFGDVDGNQKTDIGYYRDETVGFYRQGADGRFTDGERRDLTTGKRKRRELFLKFEIPPRVGDFNDDGFMDLVLIYPSKGRTHVFYGRAGRTDFTEPDEVLKIADGWSTGVYLEDLDGDGKQDLIMGVIRKLGVTDGLQVLLSGRVDLELHFYPMKGDGRFAKDPVQELKFTIPFAFHVTRESAALDLTFRPQFKGDFNKDRRRDLLVPGDEGTLRIHWGVADRMISDLPGASILLQPPAGTVLTESVVADFNGDGASDLVLKHKVGDPPRVELEIRISKP